MTDVLLTDFEEVLTTTRSVRRRLDFDRPVPGRHIRDCLDLALQAPTGADAEDWRFLLIDDPDIKQQVAAEYLRVFDETVRPRMAELASQVRRTETHQLTESDVRRRTRVYETAAYLAENIGRAPWLVLACAARRDEDPRVRAALYGSVFPAVWSFQLALRSRGLGSVLTTLHLRDPGPVTRLLGIPEGVTQCALLPVAYTIGVDFSPARRRPVEEVVYVNRWGARAKDETWT